jgi:hypothetical protein
MPRSGVALFVRLMPDLGKARVRFALSANVM